jgi:hypothetical protein
MTIAALETVSNSTAFPQIPFDAAVDFLVKNGMDETVNITPSDRDINSKGEIALLLFAL